MNLKRGITAIVLTLLTLAPYNVLLLPTAEAKTYKGSAQRHRTYFQRHPYQKSGLIGAGVGAAAGGLIGGKHGIVKGAALGTGAGLGYRYLKKNR